MSACFRFKKDTWEQFDISGKVAVCENGKYGTFKSSSHFDYIWTGKMLCLVSGIDQNEINMNFYH